MRRNQWLLVGMSVLAAGALLTGCGGSGQAKESEGSNTQQTEGAAEGQQAEADSSEKVVLNYYDWNTHMKAVAEEFNASQDRIEVVFNELPDNMDVNTKLDVLAMGGGEIDILPSKDGDQFIRMSNGMFAPLNDYIEEDGFDMEASFGDMLQWCESGDVYYGLPMHASISGIYYNKDMFDAAGVDYPSDDWTWEEYKETAAKLTHGEGQDKIYGAYNHIWGGEWIHPAVTKAQFYTEDGQCNLAAEPFVKALEDRKNLDDAGYQMSYSEAAATQTSISAHFLGGKSAMAIAGSWFIRDLKNQTDYPHDFNVGFAYIPRYDETVPEKNLTLSATMLAVASTSKHPKEAYEAIKYMVTEGAMAIAESGNYPCYQPAYCDDLTNAFFEGSGITTEDGNKMFDADAQLISKIAIGPASGQYMQLITDEGNLYLTGEQSIEDTIQNIVEGTNQAIEEENGK